MKIKSEDLFSTGVVDVGEIIEIGVATWEVLRILHGRSIEGTSGVALHKAEEKVLRMAESVVVARNRVTIEERRAGGFNRA